MVSTADYFLLILKMKKIVIINIIKFVSYLNNYLIKFNIIL